MVILVASPLKTTVKNMVRLVVDVLAEASLCLKIVIRMVYT